MDCLSKYLNFFTGKIAEHKSAVNFSHDKLGFTAEAGLLNSEVMVSDTIGDRVFCGKVKCHPGVRTFTKTGVEFVDGTTVKHLDAVVFATGYHLKFEFIDNEIIQGRYMYLAHRFDSMLSVNLYLGSGIVRYFRISLGRDKNKWGPYLFLSRPSEINILVCS